MLPALLQNSKERLLSISEFSKLPLNLKAKYIRKHPSYAMRKLQFFKLKKVIDAILDNIDLATGALCRRNPSNNDRWYATEEKIANDSGVDLQACRRIFAYLKDAGYIMYKRVKNSKVRMKFITDSFFVHFFKHSMKFVKEQRNKFKDQAKKVKDRQQQEDKLLSLERELGLKEKPKANNRFKSTIKSAFDRINNILGSNEAINAEQPPKILPTNIRPKEDFDEGPCTNKEQAKKNIRDLMKALYA